MTRMESKDITILTNSITLDKFLKWAGIADSGGFAKQLIQNNQVYVNNVIENRRSRTLHPGDIVCVQEHCYQVTVREHE